MRPSDLDPERWRQIDGVLDAALDTPPEERAAFLDQACGDDEDLRAELESLLEAHRGAEDSLERPVSPLGAALLASPDDLGENQLVGPFRLLREIGRGGMGVVYLAQDTRLGRYVALKALPPYLGVGQEAKQRFVAEARAVSALDHPNIATLYEIDETAEGQLYMAFAYYEGETLDACIARGPLPPNEAVRVATGIAAGLAAAHEKGIVHRDVKPSNVLLTEGGLVKLLDFGVAKVVGEEVTGTGLQLGTVAFMSPEHARGAKLDGRADLWSLGVVLYEMLTGVRPFQGASQVSLVQSILHHEPETIDSLRDDLPNGLGPVVRRLLSKDPQGRYQSAEDLLLDFHAVRRGGALSGGSWVEKADRAPSIRRLAVIPLENLSGDTQQVYFVDGIHAGLVGELGKIGSISVISRTSVLRFRDAELPLPAIAAELDVDALVEGSVQRQGEAFTLDVRLVAASPERTLWSEHYQADLGRAFAVTSGVARSIADEIGAPLGPQERDRLASGGEDPTVLDLYYRGRYSLDLRTRQGFVDAQRFLERAIELDPSFSPAYGLLAEAYGQPAFFGLVDPRRILPHVKELIETALSINTSVAQVYSAKAHVSLFWDRDAKAAEEAARKAIELNPSYAPAYWALAEVLSVQRRDDEAQEAAESGSALELFTPFSRFRPVVVLQHQRKFAQAIERATGGEGMGFYQDFWQGRYLHGLSLAGVGRYGEAIDECQAAVEISGGTPMALGALGYVYARAGQRESALQAAEELEARAAAGKEYVGPCYVAMVYAGMGDTDPACADSALAWLERAFEERDVTLIQLADQAFWDPISSDPRFAAILGKMGLSPRVPGE